MRLSSPTFTLTVNLPIVASAVDNAFASSSTWSQTGRQPPAILALAISGMPHLARSGLLSLALRLDCRQDGLVGQLGQALRQQIVPEPAVSARGGLHSGLKRADASHGLHQRAGQGINETGQARVAGSAHRLARRARACDRLAARRTGSSPAART